MRRLVAVLIAAALALSILALLAGCGAAATTTSPTTVAETPVTAGPISDGSDANRSENATTVFAPFPTGDFVPADLKAKIDAKRPTIIYFYDSGQNTSARDRTIIDTVRDNNRGVMDLVAYDIGKYVKVNNEATLTIDPKFTGDKTAQQSVQLARALKVSFTPWVVVTDGQGYIIWQHRGLIDQVILDREVQRAAR